MARLLPLLLSSALPLATACIERSVTEVTPTQDKTENLDFTVDLNQDLDILFVIDDSRSMEREQDEIVENFHRMIEVLEGLPTGLPNIHLGVISTDVGAGEACNAPSPGPGVLRNAPMIAGCTPPSDRWIADVDDGSGGRSRNYSGDLSDTFACIARLGIDGCGFEQPLEAMRAAIDPATLENAGFLREGALLAVVFLTDEDDCSAFNANLFTTDTESLGPLENFRCFQHGIDCEGVDPTTLGARENCVPRDDSPYLTPIGDYVDALRAVSRRVVVAGILGDAEPVRVGVNERDHTDVLRSCEIGTDDPQGAYPPTRTDAFLAQFEDRVRTRICDADLSPAIVAITEEIVREFYGSCIEGTLADANPGAAGVQADCSVTEIQNPGAADELSTVVPQCNAGASNPPCWSVVVNAERCATVSDHHLEVAMTYPDGVDRDPDTLIQVQCRTE
jgi:hypothetical protein